MSVDNGIPGITTHARERMAEIHGRDLTRAEWLRVMFDILDRRSVLCSRQPNGSEIHGIDVAGFSIWVAYHPDRAKIVTVLPSSTPSFAAAYTRASGTVRQLLRRDMAHGTWHRGSKLKSTVMENRETRGRADAWEDDGE